MPRVPLGMVKSIEFYRFWFSAPCLSVPWSGQIQRTLFKCTLGRRPVLSVPWSGQVQRTLFKCTLGRRPVLSVPWSGQIQRTLF